MAEGSLTSALCRQILGAIGRAARLRGLPRCTSLDGPFAGKLASAGQAICSVVGDLMAGREGVRSSRPLWGALGVRYPRATPAKRLPWGPVPGRAAPGRARERCCELLTSRHMPKIACLPDKIPFSTGEGETILETALRSDVPLREDTG